MRRWVIVAALVLSALPVVGPGAPTQAQAAGVVRESGYLTMDDGVRLAYSVVRPEGPGPFPTLFEYSGYDPGTNPDAGYIRRFVEQDGGYAYLGVNLRGTGCSDGTFDFFQPQEAVDGAAVIAWVREQPWSDGLVGMVGKSYPGITQLFVAAQQPPGLAAIAPGHFFADAYRDVAYPGGIANHGFATLWSFIGRPSYEFQSGPGAILDGDLRCVNALTSMLRGLRTNPYLQLLENPHDGPLAAERSPITYLDRIEVPMLATLSWQDEQLASRQTHLLAALEDLGGTSWWATLTNGDHGMSRTAPALEELHQFYDHFLKGLDNGWTDRPRVRVWWEAGRDGRRAPGWESSLDGWSEAGRRAAGELAPWPLALRAGGQLSPEPAGAGEAPTTYAYVPVLGSQGVANPRYALPDLPDHWFWDQAPPDGTAAAFTTGPFAEDVTLLGSASLDLWLAVTSIDVDLQVTLTEIRPDGQEVHVQQGWLRASKRALDADRSTELLPYQTHTAADVALLAPGVPTPVRIEVFPFGHVFREGSRLRIWVEAPTFLPQLWAFTPTPVPAKVTILHDDDHPSQLVLPLVPSAPPAPVALPECGSVIRQPCRPDPLGVVASAALTPPGRDPGAPGDPSAGPGRSDAPAAQPGRPDGVPTRGPERGPQVRGGAEPAPTAGTLAALAAGVQEGSPLPRTGAAVPLVLAALAALGAGLLRHASTARTD